MAYIYKITNDINGKIYIGKTEQTIEIRFKEHCKDSKRETEEKRPLYQAMNKYGVEHFHIELVEETDNPEEREIYWIEYFGSFKYGYNATLGGDGKRYCDYDLVFALYLEGKSCKEISKILHYDKGTCGKIIKQFGITREELKRRRIEAISVPVAQLDKNTEEIINVFSSISEAYRELGKQYSGHIGSVCKGKRKSAYGFKWKYL